MRKTAPLIILTLSLCFVLSACSGNNPPPNDSDTNPSSEKTATVYFESDEVVNSFFSDYNEISEIPIPSDKIEKGSIKTKALVYIDDLDMEVINARDVLSISISTSPENEDSNLYAIFRDVIKGVDSTIPDDSIQSTWDALHETGYLVSDYDFDGITISYIPCSLSSQPRIDLQFPMD